MRNLLLATTVFVLTMACNEDLPGEMPNEDQIRVVSEQSGMSISDVREYYLNCAREGGKGIIGGFGQPACEKQAPDAGQACTQDSDCEGFCMAETKTCTPQNPMFGCFATLPSPGKEAMVCVD